MASVTLLQPPDSGTTEVLEDLVRESLRALLPVSVALAWVWLAYVIVADAPYLEQAYGVLALLAVSAAASYALHQRRLALAVNVYLVALIAASTVLAWTLQGSACYLYVLVVLVAAMLTNAPTLWGVTLASIGLILGAASRHRLPTGDLVSLIGFISLAALTAWLSARRLFTALGWALSMTKEAQRNAQVAQERRGEVRSMLKSLDEAYARLERANEALIYAREAAERAYRFKAEFVANVSHELRTPLNLVVGFSEMVATAPESYGGTPLPSEYRGDVMAIYRSARHLEDLINDVLDLSQVEAGRLGLDREPADVREVIHEATEIVRGLVEAKGLRLEVDVPENLPRLPLDRTRIRQVLLNLLTNATRFTEQGWIRVRAGLEGEEVRVTVEDSGWGIPQDKIERAFEAFSQLHEGQLREGSGLGLAVSKRFVELHGGTMWIESTPGEGTTVALTLPLPAGSQDASPALLLPGRPIPGQVGKPAVLVLGDDAQAVRLLQRYVEGYRFVPAGSAESARALTGEERPAAVIVDSRWAGRWPEVEAQVGLPAQVPVLCCPLPGLRRLALALGVVEYLTKPVTREQLLAALARVPRSPRRVLVVDDDPSFVRLVTRILKAHDGSITVLEASGGAEGLALARSQRPDVVLLDLLMPEVSGYDFLVALKGDEELAGMPVIILSARGVEDETAPLPGEVRLARAEGFAPGQILELIQALLPAVSRLGAVARASTEQRTG